MNFPAKVKMVRKKMVQMNYLGEEQRPQSNDPDYWDIWTAHGDNSRKSDWVIAHDWQEAGQIA